MICVILATTKKETLPCLILNPIGFLSSARLAVPTFPRRLRRDAVHNVYSLQ
jgi:hypothetical protein